MLSLKGFATAVQLGGLNTATDSEELKFEPQTVVEQAALRPAAEQPDGFP